MITNVTVSVISFILINISGSTMGQTKDSFSKTPDAFKKKGKTIISRQAVVLTAQQLFNHWSSRDITLSSGKSQIELEYGEVYENDGVAAGYSYTPNQEELSDQIQARKELIVANPQAYSARLLLEHTGKPAITINGQNIDLQPVGGGGKVWKAYAFDPAFLRKGSNMIIISGKATIPIALEENYHTLTNHPDRSYRSTDEGKTWDKQHLGPGGKLDGEYYVRLYLEHFRPLGSLLSPVIDAGNLHGHTIAPALTGLKPVQVRVNSKNGLGGKIVLRARTGTTLIPSGSTWSAWYELNPAHGIIQKPKGRYIQLSLDVSTTDPLQSPKLHSIHIEANHPVAKDWTMNTKVIRQQNNEITRSVIDFAYEPFDNPKLKQLRQEYHLDEVVRGAATEFEMITRLAAWSSKQWNKRHLNEFYPSWDALEILKPYKDGTPVGGFCEQYNLVFLQACESFGLVGRAISMSQGETKGNNFRSGHEVVEIWSNEYAKWIYVDGNMAWYAADKKGIPLSLLELRERQISFLKGKNTPLTIFTKLVPGTMTWQSLKDWPPFMELRMIPRSNFLQQTNPLPLNQGMHDWPWTGHEVWVDNETSPNLIYPNRLRRPGNWQWTLNQAHLTLEATNTPGVIRVHLDTNTPGFQTFLANGKPVKATFDWVLHPGSNNLQVYSQNTANRTGPPSSIVLEWKKGTVIKPLLLD